MADFKLTSKTTKVTPSNDFWIHIVDPSDTSADPLGTSFKMSREDFLGALFDSVFTSLSDVPNSYSGQGLKTVQVNAAENALVFEFANFLALNDVSETTFIGKDGQIVKVNATEDGLEFSVNSFVNLIDVSEPTLENQQGKFVYVDANLATEPATYSLKFKNLPTYEDILGGNAIINGGLIKLTGANLDYEIWGQSYIINGVYYEIPVRGNVTNNDGDATFDRFDVYFIETDNADPPNMSVGILEGTPSANPAIPTLNLLTQVQVSVISIVSGATSDGNVINEVIFDDSDGEPTEWTNTVLPAGADLTNLVDPKVGVSSALFPAYSTPATIQFQNNALWTYVSEEFLVFYIKNTGVFVPQASMQIKLINSAVLNYWTYNLTPQNLTNFGYVIGETDWQLIQVPLSNFIPNDREATQFNILEIVFDRTPILGFDWIVLQGSVPNPSFVQTFKAIQFETGIANPPHQEGLVFYDDTEKALSYYNDNSDETVNLIPYDQILGWGFYTDDEVLGQTITTTPSKIVINGLGSQTDTDYLPKEIRGVSELWDASTSKITPISLGDGYTLRLDMEVLSEGANPNEILIQLDIGGAATPTVVILSKRSSTAGSTPYTISEGFPVFVKSTFLTNGGQIFISTDTGTLTLGVKQISIHRISKGSL